MSSNGTIASPAPAKISSVTTQPKAESMRMNPLASQNGEAQEACVHNRGPAHRLRGGGAAKGCCDCVADILCAFPS
ncbi:hypothetical protein H0H87_002657 [Tephrocybe sp. NHM501043]|nr:hypothetical protein H0H87_002657 [Tephrocybe sp. NHM501043]